MMLLAVGMSSFRDMVEPDEVPEMEEPEAEDRLPSFLMTVGICSWTSVCGATCW